MTADELERRTLAVLAAINACPAACEARAHAAAIIDAARARDDLAAAEQEAVTVCAEGAVAVLEDAPSIGQLIETGALGVYLLRQAAGLAQGGTWLVEMDLREPAN